VDVECIENDTSSNESDEKQQEEEENSDTDIDGFIEKDTLMSDDISSSSSSAVSSEDEEYSDEMSSDIELTLSDLQDEEEEEEEEDDDYFESSEAAEEEFDAQLSSKERRQLLLLMEQEQRQEIENRRIASMNRQQIRREKARQAQAETKRLLDAAIAKDPKTAKRSSAVKLFESSQCLMSTLRDDIQPPASTTIEVQANSKKSSEETLVKPPKRPSSLMRSTRLVRRLCALAAVLAYGVEVDQQEVRKGLKTVAAKHHEQATTQSSDRNEIAVHAWLTLRRKFAQRAEQNIATKYVAKNPCFSSKHFLKLIHDVYHSRQARIDTGLSTTECFVCKAKERPCRSLVLTPQPSISSPEPPVEELHPLCVATCATVISQHILVAHLPEVIAQHMKKAYRITNIGAPTPPALIIEVSDLIYRGLQVAHTTVFSEPLPQWI